MAPDGSSSLSDVNQSAAEARASADAAKAVVSEISEIEKRLQTELQEVVTDRRITRRAAHSQFAQAGASIATMLCVVWQAYQIEQQISLNQRTIDLTKGQLTVSQEQIAETKANNRLSFLQQLAIDKNQLDSQIEDSKGVLARLKKHDPNCVSPPDRTSDDNEALDRVVSKYFAYYERYFIASSSLHLHEDWSFICRSARLLRDDNCHLDAAVTGPLSKMSREFQEGFSQCTIP